MYPWEISILDGVHAAVLNAALKVIGNSSIVGDLVVSGDVFATNLTPEYGEMYIYSNSTETVINTVNTPIALRNITSGLVSGFAFDAGRQLNMDSFNDYSGTVAGAVRLYDAIADHRFSTGDVITISNTTNYNGIFEVTKIDDYNFYIIAAWAGDDGVSNCIRGTSLTALTGSAGVYTSTWQMTTAPAGACELCFKVNINETPQNKSTACRDMAINDKDNNSSTCLLTIADGDIIWLSVESDSTDNIVNSMGNINLEKLFT